MVCLIKCASSCNSKKFYYYLKAKRIHTIIDAVNSSKFLTLNQKKDLFLNYVTRILNLSVEKIKDYKSNY